MTSGIEITGVILTSCQTYAAREGGGDFRSYLYIRELTGGNGRSRSPSLARATDGVPLQGCC